MTTFTARTVLPVPRTEAFDFVTTPENWPRFISSAESVREVHDWGAVGGRARVAGRFLGRSVVWEAEVLEWRPPVTFRYRLRRPGLPELVNTRVFDEAAGGTALTAVTGLALRSGIRGLRDRVDVALVRRSTVRALRDLEALLGER